MPQTNQYSGVHKTFHNVVEEKQIPVEFKVDLIAIAKKHAIGNEDLTDSIVRALVVQTLYRNYGNQRATGRELQTSHHKINRLSSQYGIRPKDILDEIQAKNAK